MYGRSSAMTPVTIMNRIVFVMNLFPLNLLFAIVPPFFEVEIEKAPGLSAEGPILTDLICGVGDSQKIKIASGYIE